MYHLYGRQLTFCSLAMILVFSFLPMKSPRDLSLVNSFPAHHSWAVASSNTSLDAYKKRNEIFLWQLEVVWAVQMFWHV